MKVTGYSSRKTRSFGTRPLTIGSTGGASDLFCCSSQRRGQILDGRYQGDTGRRVDREMVVPLLPERHSRIIGASLSASFTHLIRVASPASVAGGISIGACVGYCRNHISIAVDINVG